MASDVEWVLFVCSGNICRSPAAETVFNHLAAEKGLSIRAFSRGTGEWHEGEQMDPRMREALRKNGYRLTRHRARQLQPQDLERANLVLVMDRGHLAELKLLKTAWRAAGLCVEKDFPQAELFLAYSGLGEIDVEDPYYQGHEAFYRVLTVIEEGCERLIERFCTEMTPG